MEEEIVVIEDNNIEEIDIEEENYSGKPYELPIASADTLGGIKIGENLTIDEDGTLNAKASESVDLTEYAKKDEFKTINGQTIIGEGDIVIEGDGGTGSGGSLEIETITVPLEEGIGEDGKPVEDFIISIQKCGNFCILNFFGGYPIKLESGKQLVVATIPEGYRPTKTFGGQVTMKRWDYNEYYSGAIVVSDNGIVKLEQWSGKDVVLSQVLGQFAYYVDEPMPIIGENVDISKYATIEDMENTINEAIGNALEGEY